MLLSYDIEISDLFEVAEGEDWSKFAPFHISVAATAEHAEDGEELHWHGVKEDGTPTTSLDAAEAKRLLLYLREKQKAGVKVCAWNGLSFDLRWIGWNAGDFALAREVALASYDPMFQFFCIKGFPVSLASVGKGFGIEQKKLMTGDKAPLEWANGNFDLVKAYVLGDCQITNQVVAEIERRHCVSWITKKGKPQSVAMPRLKTVAECIAEPFFADQSWMDEPMRKEGFYEWFKEAETQACEEDECPF